ncbi:hypothetical protein [Fictibacillus nanhaiensis]|uniref:hypothetical protein n=1 Tax=Fictibacillus nanhaiensis TaxID=742169 RepID=UPI003C2A3ABC
MARSGRRLTVRPMESEQHGAEINYCQSPPWKASIWKGNQYFRKHPLKKSHKKRKLKSPLMICRKTQIKKSAFNVYNKHE